MLQVQKPLDAPRTATSTPAPPEAPARPSPPGAGTGNAALFDDAFEPARTAVPGPASGPGASSFEPAPPGRQSLLGERPALPASNGPPRTPRDDELARDDTGVPDKKALQRQRENQPTYNMSAKEMAAYSALTGDQRQRYDALHADSTKSARTNLRALLSAGRFPEYLRLEDAVAGGNGATTDVYRLQDLLQRGALTGGKGRDGKDLLAQLGALASGPEATKQGLDRHDLLLQVVRDVHSPYGIVQGTNNYCAGTAAAVLLAGLNPAEYTRIISGLAEQGSAQLGAWKLQYRPEDASRFGSTTQQLFAGAFAAGGHLQFVGQALASRWQFSGIPSASIGEQLARMYESFTKRNPAVLDMAPAFSELTGTQWAGFQVPSETEEPNAGRRAEAQAQAERVIRELAARGRSAVVNVAGSDGVGHYVTVLGVRGNGPDAKVTYATGTGEMRTVSMKDFIQATQSVLHEAGLSAPVPSWMLNDSWDQGGIGGDPKLGTTGSGN